MLLYLVRHGTATDAADDPERPLTPGGRGAVGRVAGVLAAGGAARPGRIVHSGKLRARQTAEILADALLEEGTLEVADDLGPNDDPAPWAGRGDEGEPLMLVGHLPFLHRLAALLVTGNPDAGVVRLPAGAVLALERDGSGRWVVSWLVTPEILVR